LPALTGGVVVAQTRILMPVDIATVRPGAPLHITGTVVPVGGTISVEVRTTYTVTGPISYTSPPESSTIYIPDVDIHGMDFIDVRDLNKMLIEIDADQPITVEVENSPTGDIENSRPLAGYMLVSTLFDVSRRNTIALDGAGACVGFIRLKTITGEVAPSEINVWIEAK